MKNSLVLFAILLLALLLRVVGINWDDHSHLHPDERFLTNIVGRIGMDESLTDAAREGCTAHQRTYFNTACSNLNPNNVEVGSFAYGTLPVFIMRGAATLLVEISGDPRPYNYDYVHFVARGVNALADVLTVLFVFLIGRRLFSVRHGLVAAALYACAVLPVQLAHFGTVDVLAHLFFVVGFYAAVGISQSGAPPWYVLFGLASGAALASRVNIFPMLALLPLAAGLYLWSLRGGVGRRGWVLRGWVAVLLAFAALGVAVVAFRVFQPYAFAGPNFGNFDLNPKWVDDMQTVGNFSRVYNEGWVPSLQWVGRAKYLYAWYNMAMWGMGAALGAVASLALGVALYQQGRARVFSPQVGLLCAWVLVYFGFNGGLHQMTMRYYLPLYAVLCLLAAWLVLRGRWQRYAAGFLLGAGLLWVFAFTNIYRHPLTRLEASRWMVAQLPATVTLEAADGTSAPANLRYSDLRYSLMTAFKEEMYLSEGFEITADMQITAIRMAFADGQPASVNLRFLANEDTQAENPLAVYRIAANTPLAVTDFPAVEPGFYRWHMDATWADDAPIRHLMPLVEWRDPAGETRLAPLRFLSPYQGVPYAHLSPSAPLTLNRYTPFEAAFISFPHQIGTAATLTLRVGESEVLARAEPPNQAAANLVGGRVRYVLERPTVLDPDQPMSLSADAPLFITGTLIATEGAWDDALPWSFCEDKGARPWYHPVRFFAYCRNVNPYALGYYPELPLNMAEPDNHIKHLRLVDILQKADYLVISSNRFYDALPRQSERFPFSTHYYEQLFGGALNYTPERQFTRYPTVLGVPLRDQALPPTHLGGVVNALEAEEAFTVYDHPTVFIFRNTGFAVEDLAPIFALPDTRSRIDLGDYAATTFTAPAEAPTNRSVQITVLLWVVGLWGLGWLGYPLMFVLLAGLPLRGFAFGRGVAWLGLALVAWWLTSVGLPLWTRAALWGLVLGYAALNGALAWRYRDELRAYLRQHARAFVAVEGLFVLALLFGLLLRALNPDLWHDARGGEKPMDFAYLNAVLRSPSFPPPNPWMSGFAINYYYFGFVVAALPIKLGGFAPEVGANLVLGSLYALVFVSVFSLAYAFLGRAQNPRLRATFALVGTLFVMLAGNLGTVYLWVANPEPNMHPNRWYWYPTRIIGESSAGRDAAFNEFPVFSFLYGDLHAHIIALLPVVLYVLVAWVLLRGGRALWATVLGVLAAVLYMTNTWDVIIYAPLGGVVLLLAAGRSARRFAWMSAAAVAGGVLTLAPYYLHFVLGENGGFARWYGAKTPLLPFLGVWGVPVGVAALWLLARAKRVLAPQADSPIELGMLILAVVPLLLLPATTGTAVLCLILVGAGVLLALFDHPANRPTHGMIAVIFGVLLLLEYVVIKGDVGRQNTVFKVTYQLWLWLGLLLPILLHDLWTWNKARLQVYMSVGLLGLGLLYPLRALPARHADNQTGNLTLDGSQFMQTMTLYADGDPITVARDAALVRWLRQNVQGFPVIAEWYEREYWWNSRIAAQTGLPSVVGWATHMRQQYTHQNAEVEQRLGDIRTLYTTSDPDELRQIINRYGVAYVIFGGLEQSATPPETAALFAAMVQNGEWEVVYDHMLTQVFRVKSGAGGQVH